MMNYAVNIKIQSRAIQKGISQMRKWMKGEARLIIAPAKYYAFATEYKASKLRRFCPWCNIKITTRRSKQRTIIIIKKTIIHNT